MILVQEVRIQTILFGGEIADDQQTILVTILILVSRKIQKKYNVVFTTFYYLITAMFFIYSREKVHNIDMMI